MAAQSSERKFSGEHGYADSHRNASRKPGKHAGTEFPIELTAERSKEDQQKFGLFVQPPAHGQGVGTRNHLANNEQMVQPAVVLRRAHPQRLRSRQDEEQSLNEVPITP
jgi:hypothetical protein